MASVKWPDGPGWAASFPTGRISIRNLDWPPPAFQPQISQFNHAKQTVLTTLQRSNDIGLNNVPIDGKVVQLTPSRPIAFERFQDDEHVMMLLASAVVLFGTFAVLRGG